MEALLKRSEQEPQNCWNLQPIIKDETEYCQLKKKVLDCSHEITKMKGYILADQEHLMNFLKVSEEENRAYERLLVYTKFLLDQDTKNSESKKKSLEIEQLGNTVNEQESFIKSELMKGDLEEVKKLLPDSSYELYFERIYFNKKRILSEAEEKIITMAYNTFGSPEETFEALDDADVSFGCIKDENGNLVLLTHANYNQFLSSPNQSVRKDAFMKYHEYYQKHEHTFAALLKGNYQELEFNRAIRKYKDALEMALDEARIDPKVYDNLIQAVHQYNIINVNYQKLKSRLIGNKEYHLYDTYVSVIPKLDQKHTKEESLNLVKTAISILGKDYEQHFDRLVNGHTVDYFPNEGKRSGAYQWGCYDTPSYVLLNYNGNFDSVSTMAHEFGHAIHSMYAKENNSYNYYAYEIFVAEIASTVNETILSNYMLKKSKTKEEKMYFLGEFLDKVKATIYRQTMFAEFERLMSEKCQKKESLTNEEITESYYKLNQEYFKDSVVVDDMIRYECYRIPHFYSPFYVYQYATGLICAICIVSDILSEKEGFKDKYIQFLSLGSKKDVLDLLKIVDIDLTTMEPFDKAFHYINEMYHEFETLTKEGEK